MSLRMCREQQKLDQELAVAGDQGNQQAVRSAEQRGQNDSSSSRPYIERERGGYNANLTEEGERGTRAICGKF